MTRDGKRIKTFSPFPFRRYNYIASCVVRALREASTLPFFIAAGPMFRLFFRDSRGNFGKIVGFLDTESFRLDHYYDTRMIDG